MTNVLERDCVTGYGDLRVPVYSYCDNRNSWYLGTCGDLQGKVLRLAKDGSEEDVEEHEDGLTQSLVAAANPGDRFVRVFSQKNGMIDVEWYTVEVDHKATGVIVCV